MDNKQQHMLLFFLIVLFYIGFNASLAQCIGNTAPVADIGGPYYGGEGSPIYFDASGSYDIDGPILVYEWDWDNDGTYDEPSFSPTISHTWMDGFYTVVLRVTDYEGATNIDTADVIVYDLGPNAAFSHNGPQEEGSPVSFTDESTSYPDIIVAWIWDFGDGDISTAQNPSHAYTYSGLYTVGLTIFDYDGSSAYIEHEVKITPPAILSLVVKGSNEKIYYNPWDESGSNWVGWTQLPGSTPDRPATAKIGTDLHLVVRGSNGGIYHGVMDLSTDDFNGWTKIFGDTPSAPSLTATETGLILTVRGDDNKIYYSTYDGSWNAWNQLPGSTPDAVGTSVIGDTYHIMVRGGDGKMYHGKMTVSTETWLGWTVMSGTTPSQPVLCDDEENLYLVVRGSDNGIYWSEYAGTWSTWHKISGSTLQSPGAAVYNNELWVCVTGMTTGFYYSNTNLDTYIWSGWGYLGGSSPSPPTLIGE